METKKNKKQRRLRANKVNPLRWERETRGRYRLYYLMQNATAMFHSMDILVSYLQQNTKNNGVHVNYTLLSDYFDAVWAAGEKEDVQWPQNSGSDFFPLFESLYWTVYTFPPSPLSLARLSNIFTKGYYTSRTQLKGIVRQGEAAARTAEQMYEQRGEAEKEEGAKV